MSAQQSADAGLTFQFKQFDFRRLNMGTPQLVYASGAIRPGDLARLTAFNSQNAVRRGAVLVLDSPGGNVVEATAMARYIRSVGMDTWVGARPTVPDEVSKPGGCYSACTLLFLGGVHRSVGRTSSFGVHRFFWTGEEGGSDVAQILFGQIVSFVKEMGADPGLTVEMSGSGQDEINILPASRMAQLGVTTPVFETEWSIEPVDRTFIVNSVTRDPRRQQDRQQPAACRPACGFRWRVGDKSGSGDHGTRNDIGIIVPPGGVPIVAAVYYTESVEPRSSREQVIAEAGRIIALSLGT